MNLFLFLFLFFCQGIIFGTNYSKFEPLDAKVMVIEQKGLIIDRVLNFAIIFIFLFAIFFTFFLLINLKKISFSDVNKELFKKIIKMLNPLRITIFLIVLIGLISFLINLFSLVISLKLPLNLILTLNSQSITAVLRNSMQLSVVLIFIYFLLEIWIEKKIVG